MDMPTSFTPWYKDEFYSKKNEHFVKIHESNSRRLNSSGYLDYKKEVLPLFLKNCSTSSKTFMETRKTPIRRRILNQRRILPKATIIGVSSCKEVLSCCAFLLLFVSLFFFGTSISTNCLFGRAVSTNSKFDGNLHLFTSCALMIISCVFWFLKEPSSYTNPRSFFCHFDQIYFAFLYFGSTFISLYFAFHFGEESHYIILSSATAQIVILLG